MKKYNYLIIRHMSDNLQNHEDMINQKAKEGYEAVNITSEDGMLITLMKKEKGNADKKNKI